LAEASGIGIVIRHDLVRGREREYNFATVSLVGFAFDE
jgi:hypothetical protein